MMDEDFEDDDDLAMSYCDEAFSGSDSDSAGYSEEEKMCLSICASPPDFKDLKYDKRKLESNVFKADLLDHRKDLIN